MGELWRFTADLSVRDTNRAEGGARAGSVESERGLETGTPRPDTPDMPSTYREMVREINDMVGHHVVVHVTDLASRADVAYFRGTARVLRPTENGFILSLGEDQQDVVYLDDDAYEGSFVETGRICAHFGRTQVEIALFPPKPEEVAGVGESKT